MACEQTSSAASNHGQEDSKRIDVMFLCDEWKSCKGGLSTFNREFAVNLAETTRDSINVHCYVAQSDEQSREDARKHGVNLITARSIPGSSDPLDWLKIPPPQLPNPDIVVGHGRKFGIPAYFIVQTAKCKWMHFVHVFCEDLGKFKATQSAAVDTIEENEKKHKNEIELCKAADVVVAVGSRLQQKYSRSLPKVERITPGILQKFLSESSQLVKDRAMVKTFNVFLFGRASFEDLPLKGYDIVANAIGSLGEMFELTFVGSSPGEHKNIEQWFLDNTCISRNQITIRSYCNEQDELKMMFHQSDMIALPSRTEGFGLIALEAISAGISVLVAGESGIAEALLQVDSGQSFIVKSDDAKVWAQRIQQLSMQSQEERENNAKLLRDNYDKTYPWRSECERFKRMIQDLAKSRNVLKLRIDVETMKPAEHNTQTLRTPASTVESGGSQNGGLLPKASAVPVPSGQTQPSSAQAEAPQAPMSPIPKVGEVLCLIATNYLQATPLKCKDDTKDFLAYMEKMQVIFKGFDLGSLLITVKCDSLQILEGLWEEYLSGHLSEVVQRCFVTEEILTELSLVELKLKTAISEEEYKACKKYLGKDPAIEADETGDGNDLASDDEEADDGDVSVSDDEDQLRSLPVHVSTRCYKEEILTEEDSDSGISSASSSHSVTDPNYSTSEDSRMEILKGKLPRIAKAGLEMFDVSSPEKLQDYLTYLTHKMDSEGLLRTRRSVSDKPLSAWAHASKEGGRNSTTPEEQPYTEEENIRPEDGATADEHTASSIGSELQEHEKWGRSVAMQKTSKPVQESPCVKNLTETLDDEEFRQFVSVHVKEGKWQVVMLFFDELLHRQGVSEVERNVREKSRTLSWWPTDEDKDLVTLCKMLTNSDCRINSLNLSESNITDEGLEHLAEVLPKRDCQLSSLDLSWSNLADEKVKRVAEKLLDRNCKLKSLNLSHLSEITSKGVEHIAKALNVCKLNSLDLSEVNMTDEGVEHLSEAVKEGTCNLNSLNLSYNHEITDQGVAHLAEALKYSDGKLKSLNLEWSNVTDEGVKHLAEGLKHSNCRLNSLNLSRCELTDEGVKHLAEVLKHSNCKLNSLNLSCCEIKDEGVKHLAEALKHSNCKLNSLDLSNNIGITDEGVQHLAEALKHRNCELNSLNISDNYGITDEGIKHLAEALKHSNFK